MLEQLLCANCVHGTYTYIERYNLIYYDYSSLSASVSQTVGRKSRPMDPEPIFVGSQ